MHHLQQVLIENSFKVLWNNVVHHCSICLRLDNVYSCVVFIIFITCKLTLDELFFPLRIKSRYHLPTLDKLLIILLCLVHQFESSFIVHLMLLISPWGYFLVNVNFGTNILPILSKSLELFLVCQLWNAIRFYSTWASCNLSCQWIIECLLYCQVLWEKFLKWAPIIHSG